ncbi:Cyclin-L1-1 [Hibiscus syriacus]|uniref:Cyclin-L1-1 n=1 Tax=Hibiscus syriacus TaxID=106335 RepID=A0A6A3AEV3_HIBSY|nr:Cyclin-L1-1 [Hibiscus syriacus]
MIYTAIDNFYLTDEQLKNSPSTKDGIDEATETTLGIYGCDLIQESGILLKLLQAVMATGQVLFLRFDCKKSFARFDVKIVAASSLWLASKLDESPRRARQKFSDLKAELSRTERHVLKEMGFVCHVEHPHKFISNYLATLRTPPELRQEAWNLANDSPSSEPNNFSRQPWSIDLKNLTSSIMFVELRFSFCNWKENIPRKGEFQISIGLCTSSLEEVPSPLPENPPWWKAFDAESGIDEVCRVLAHLYNLPKAQYIPVCKDGKPFTFSTRSANSQSHPTPKEVPPGPLADNNANASDINVVAADVETEGAKEAKIKMGLDKLKESKQSDDESKSMPTEEKETGREQRPGIVTEAEILTGKESETRLKGTDKHKDRGHRSKDTKDSGGHSEKSRHHSSRGRKTVTDITRMLRTIFKMKVIMRKDGCLAAISERLNKSLYGLKQAPRCWYKRFDSFIMCLGYNRLNADPCTYFKRFGDNDFVILMLYVDDMLVVGPNKDHIEELKAQLAREFEMNELGSTNKILGMQIHQDRSNRKIWLSQKNYLKKILSRFNMQDCKSISTPLPINFKLSSNMNPSSEEDRMEMSRVPYASAVGSLMFAMICTRPDIAQAVGVVSRYMANLDKEHWNTTKRYKVERMV